MSKLSPRLVKEIEAPGTYQDGRGLFLKVTSSGSKSWVFRYSIHGRRRDMGIGTYPDVSLKDARLRADKSRLELAKGVDPLARRDELRAAEARMRRKGVDFRDEAEQYIRTHSPSWSAKHAQQWRSSLAKHVFPVIGHLGVDAIDTNLVLDVLTPIWPKIPVTASRLRNRIELILDAAKARGHRSGENPARWRGHLDKLLPRQKRVIRPSPAMPAGDISGLMHKLDSLDTPAARATELLILSACRSKEVCNAEWSEFDFANRTWTIPASRMKARRDHRVPLTEEMIAVLKQQEGKHPRFVFLNKWRSGPLPGNAIGRVLVELGAGHVVPHGFRSSFRTWAAEYTNYPREVCEMALAHTLESKVEAAYNRADLLEKRRALMSDWACFVGQRPSKCAA
ncbi:integrase arm-type DNA-binding domain-containing protein [Aquipseudomonas alcaligenes]|uniref:Integrase n=1 Tax=Aquipseudomonas alcaligenes TaxID=43263 RepID=A0A1N6X9E7_AQUAC|nr:integrase arm-type DNA-binding domain-containing protein [Pseudomonas alcaligenes]SIQ98897.1 Integrase [Pseudomonas alcaligenes]